MLLSLTKNPGLSRDALIKEINEIKNDHTNKTRCSLIQALKNAADKAYDENELTFSEIYSDLKQKLDTFQKLDALITDINEIENDNTNETRLSLIQAFKDAANKTYDENELTISEIYSDLKQKLDFFQKLDAQLELIDDKSCNLKDRGHEKAYQEANKLYKTISQSSIDYFSSNSADLEKVKGEFITAIDAARPELEKHRGWKKILYNLGFFLVSFGVGYLVAGLTNLARGKNFFFKIQTDSGKKLSDLKTGINQISQKK